MKNIKPLFLLICLLVAGHLNAQQASSGCVTLKNLSDVNGEKLDFYAIPFKNGIVFTASKGNRFLGCPSDDPGGFTDLFFAEKDESGNYKTPVPLEGGVNGKYNDGVATFNQTGDKMIFTRNNMKGKNAADSIDLKLYSADLVGNSWQNVQELTGNINSDDWATCHPTLAKDGTTLIFASNRPGSMGGSMDLWKSTIVNGTWTEPVNLGPKVNTNGNELFPFIDGMGRIFFSSDGHAGGKGGLDIWCSLMDNSCNYQTPINLGEPFNRPGDDVAFSMNDNCSEGFLTSSREDGKGMDDIYSWKCDQQPVNVPIQVVDSITGAPIADANVYINISNFASALDQICHADQLTAGKPIAVKTNRNGETPEPLALFGDADYAFSADKTPEYKAVKKSSNTAELKRLGKYIIKLSPERRSFDGLVVDDATNAPIPLANVKIVDKTTGKVVKELKADGEGGFRFDMDCNHSYEFFASAEGYEENSIVINDRQACLDGKIRPVIRLKRPPTIVCLYDIYFDFDRYYIRKDARETLDSLVDLLSEYPTLKLRLVGATDSRGTSSYNDWLANQRAKSTLEYLKKKYVDAKRFTLDATGEKSLANNCTDGVPCTAAQHQANRRVVIEVLSYEEPGVVIRNCEKQKTTY
jgi:outer membrane protein OmpA-like peptidoglycan-associated protein